MSVEPSLGPAKIATRAALTLAMAWRKLRLDLHASPAIVVLNALVACVGMLLFVPIYLMINLGSADIKRLIAAALLPAVILMVAAVIWWLASPARGRFASHVKDRSVIQGLDRAKAVSNLKQRIAAYAARLPDWDGMNGTAPSPDAIADALAFVDQLPEQAPVPDNVYAPGDGEVMFQWLRPEAFIEVGFYGD